MTRPIKVRAWDGKEMIYLTLQEIYWYGEDTGDYYLSQLKAIDQFTGLLDKNGVEIFEGDIVRYNSPEFNTLQATGIVEFTQALFGVTSPGGHFSLAKVEELEIIGNIHENPELLNK